MIPQSTILPVQFDKNWFQNHNTLTSSLLPSLIGSLDHPNFKDISNSALNCISSLLEIDGARRLSAPACLEHQWLTGSYLDTLKQLETTWMRKYLAKRRWQRWFNTVKAMNRMQVR